MQRNTCSFQDRCTFQTCIYQNVLQIPFQRWLAMVKRMSLVQVVPTTSAVSTLLLWSLLGEQSYDSSLPSPPYSSGACWVTGEQTSRATKDYKNIVHQAMIAKCQHVTFLEIILRARIEPYLLMTITLLYFAYLFNKQLFLQLQSQVYLLDSCQQVHPKQFKQYYIKLLYNNNQTLHINFLNWSEI